MTRAGHKEPQGPLRATQSHFGMTSLAVSSEAGPRYRLDVSRLIEQTRKFTKTMIMVYCCERFTEQISPFWKTTDCVEQTSWAGVFI